MKRKTIDDKLTRYKTQMLFDGIKETGQRKLLDSSVVIVGAGALGGNLASLLARAGIGKIKIIDRDYVEIENLQRQLLFDEEDAARKLPKAVVVEKKLKRINSSIDLNGEICDLNPGNIEKLFKGSRLILDATDNFYTRFLINDACVKLNIPWIYGGVVASFGATINIIPGQTPCFSCILPHLPPPGTGPTCQTAGILNSVPNIIASLQATEAIKLLSGKKDNLRKTLLYLDVWENYFAQIKISKDKNCPTCASKKFLYLEGIKEKTLWTLCGRDAVQIVPPSNARISLKNLAKKLNKICKVNLVEGFVLHFNIDKYLISIFPDGRAIIKGARDKEEAKSVYSKYIGI